MSGTEPSRQEGFQGQEKVGVKDFGKGLPFFMIMISAWDVAAWCKACHHCGGHEDVEASFQSGAT